MADKNLTPKQGDTLVATPDKAAPSGEQQDILALIEEAKAAAIKEAENKAEAAFRKAQSKIDQDLARERQLRQSQQDVLLGRYRQALADHGAGAETLEELDRETAQAMELQELREKANRYDELQTQIEAQKAKEEYIRRTCESLGINPHDSRLRRDATSPDEFLISALAIFREQFAQTTQEAGNEAKRKRLEQLQQAGNLDVVGGSTGMTPPAWTTSMLDITSADPAITRTLLKYMGKLTQEEMGRLLAKTKEHMKNNPNLRAEEAARMIAMKELGRL
jgi:hypothetical protein